MVVLRGQAELLEVVGALGAAGGLAGRLHGRQQQRDQHGDDGDHDQQFDQGEARRKVGRADFTDMRRPLLGMGKKERRDQIRERDGLARARIDGDEGLLAGGQLRLRFLESVDQDCPCPRGRTGRIAGIAAGREHQSEEARGDHEPLTSSIRARRAGHRKSHRGRMKSIRVVFPPGSGDRAGGIGRPTPKENGLNAGGH